MSCKVSTSKFRAWKCMELVGILHGKERRIFVEELERKLQNNEIGANEELILLAAERSYPENKRMRRKYLKKRLKDWNKSASPQTAI